MYKFLFGFSVIGFIANLILFIKTFVWEFTWISLIVAVLGMISACLIMWSSQLLKKIKEGTIMACANTVIFLLGLLVIILFIIGCSSIDEGVKG